VRPCEEGITQVENFGIRYQRDGTTLYGLKLESVMQAGAFTRPLYSST
jgi:hypothetical protein